MFVFNNQLNKLIYLLPQITQAINELPIVPVITQEVNTLTSSEAFAYQWLDVNQTAIDGVVNQSYNPPTSGIYYVEVSNSYKCTEVSESRYLVLSDIDIIDEVIESKGIKIYPNPNTGNFKIEINRNENITDLTYNIIDITGKIVRSGNMDKNQNEQEIILQGINDGIYFIRIFDNTNYFTSKIMIKK